MNRFLSTALMAALGMSVLVSASPAQAGIVALGSLSGSVSFVTYPGGPGTIFNEPLVVSGPGETVTFNLQNGALFQRLDQSTGGWSGNFASGTPLLYTQGAQAPLDAVFSSPVTQFGFKAQNNRFGSQQFTLDVYNGASLLGGITFPASVSTPNADDSAQFLGVGATGGDSITRFVLSSTSGVGSFGDNDFAISAVGYSNGSVSAVPEPGAVATFAALFGGVGIGLLRARRRQG